MNLNNFMLNASFQLDSW